MDPVQDATVAAGSCPVQSQAPVRTWRASSKRGAGAAKTLANAASRFHGDGVHYKAKLIGVDSVPGAQGDKMCLDAMMKLKGLEAASRSHGKHKQRVCLKVSSSGLKIVDERTGVVEHDHDRNRISSLTKDESDPRALAYIYQHQDTFTLFYIKMASLADPVLNDIKEVCQRPEEPPDKPTPTSALLLLDEGLACLPKNPVELDLFSPLPDVSAGQTKQASSTEELMEIFSIQLEDPRMSSQISDSSQPGSPHQTLTISQILSNYSEPAGLSPYASPTTAPWDQRGPLASPSPASHSQWVGPTPWPGQPGCMTAWPPAGGVMSPPAGQIQAYGMNPQPGAAWGQSSAGYPGAGHPTSVVNARYPPAGGPGAEQPVSPTAAYKPSLG